MDDNNAQTSKRYIFWIYIWGKDRLGLYHPLKDKLTQCEIDSTSISTVVPLMNESDPFNIPINTIEESYLFFGRLPNGRVELRTRDLKRYTLVPANPFDPTLALQSNAAEAKAMLSIIQSFHRGEIPIFDENPYMRQLKVPTIPKFALEAGEVWDANISPWIYAEKYRAKHVQFYRRFRQIEPILIRGLFIAIIVINVYLLLFKVKW